MVESPRWMRGGAGLLRVALARRRVPIAVQWNTTSRCVYRCPFCDWWRQNHDELPFEDVRRVLAQMRKLGAVMLTLSGGETLLREDAGRMFRAASDLGFEVALSTTGEGLMDRFGDIATVDLVQFSLDGPPETNDPYKAEGAHDRVVEAMEACLRAGKTVWTTTVLHRHGCDGLEHVLALSARLGSWTSFRPLTEDLDDPSVQSFIPDRSDYLAALDRIAAAKRGGARVVNSHRALEFMRRWPDATPPGTCFAGRASVALDERGVLYPCSLLIGQPGYPNAAEIGARAAMDRLGEPRCDRCTSFENVDFNGLCQLRPWAILNTLDLMRRR